MSGTVRTDPNTENGVTMKLTKVRTLIAAGTIGLVGITGVAAAGVAGAQTTDTTTQAAQGKGAFIKSLTADQRSCLQANGVVKPDHRLTADERAALKATLESAATTCGVTLPTRPGAAAKAEAEALKAQIKALTPDQKACLKANGLTKPDHRLTAAERQARYALLETAAQTCGIAIS